MLFPPLVTRHLEVLGKAFVQMLRGETVDPITLPKPAVPRRRWFLRRARSTDNVMAIVEENGAPTHGPGPGHPDADPIPDAPHSLIP